MKEYMVETILPSNLGTYIFTIKTLKKYVYMYIICNNVTNVVIIQEIIKYSSKQAKLKT